MNFEEKQLLKNDEVKKIVAKERLDMICSVLEADYGLLAKTTFYLEGGELSFSVLNETSREVLLISLENLLDLDPFCAHCAAEQIIETTNWHSSES